MIFVLLLTSLFCQSNAQSDKIRTKEISTIRKDTFVYERVQRKTNRILFSEYYNKSNEPISIWKKYIPEKDSIILLDFNFELKYINQTLDDLVVLSLIDTTSTNDINRPSFQLGNQRLYQAIAEDLNYPLFARRIGFQGIVVVLYKILKSGDGFPVGVIKGITPELDKEALRVLREVKKWYPAKRNGMAIDCYIRLDIHFKLDD